jgi:hypothetical protein
MQEKLPINHFTEEMIMICHIFTANSKTAKKSLFSGGGRKAAEPPIQWEALRPGAVLFSRVSILLGQCTAQLVSILAAILLIAGCTTTKRAADMNAALNPNFQSSDRSMRGYRQHEAEDFIEFCVELDNQDDRAAAKGAGTPNPNFEAQVDAAEWTVADDTRELLAADVYRYSKAATPQDGDQHWAKLYADIIGRAKQERRGARAMFFYSIMRGLTATSFGRS